MQNRRLLFGVIIKLLILSGILLLIAVLVNSLFIKTPTKSIFENNKIPITKIGLTDMFKGQIRKIRWKNKEVAVLLRQFPEKLQSDNSEFSDKPLHPSLDNKTRSLKDSYFVYFNTGDSNNCPLHYAAGEFKDVCSANKFDEAGRPLSASGESHHLKIPPHYFENSDVVIGKWKP